MIRLYIFLKLPLLLTMNLHLHCGRWWPIVHPPSDAFLNFQRVFIPREVRTPLLELTYPWWYNRIARGILSMWNFPQGFLWYCHQIRHNNLVALCFLEWGTPPMIRDASICLSLVSLVHKFHCCLGWNAVYQVVVTLVG